MTSGGLGMMPSRIAFLTTIPSNVVRCRRLDLSPPFASDALVNDNHREMVGVDAIRRFVEKEIVGDQVTMEVREVIDHYGDTIVRARYDGTFDKTNLPAELVLTNYFTVRDDKIVALIIVFNQPSPY